MLTIRKATMNDSAFLFALRNDPVVRAASFNIAPVLLETHLAWLAKTVANPSRHLFVVESEGAPIGQVRFDIDSQGKSAEVSIALTASSRGRGYGTDALQQAAVKLFSQLPSVLEIHAFVKQENAASVKSFERVGYQNQGGVDHQSHPCIELVLLRS